MQFTLHKIEDWQDVIKNILPEIKHPILLLKGNLGAGKTTFTQFLLKEMGCTDEVSSPTYAIVNEYDTKKGKVFHFDLYRLNSAEEVFDIGMEEYLDSGNFCIIEWPEIYEEEIAQIPHHTIEISHLEKGRMVKFY
jgi:tRNA threonylcarbamoyladenosine biosynthesis protein TsaE